MTSGDVERIRKFAERATEIAALTEIMAAALHANTATAMTGFAVEGLGTLATMLGNDLIEFAE